jgi:redox-sensitive bicupin YhaK (pirin superfamily)
MTRLDAGPEEVEAPAACDGPRALLLHSRDVPLGGVRAMEVHRALPQRDLPMVGAWCFLDRFGPQVTRMRVEPHPHIGLQTVTWPFEGEVRHRDTVGSDVLVARGALNLMTSGAGIAHSEYSTGADAVALDALQLWARSGRRAGPRPVSARGRPRAPGPRRCRSPQPRLPRPGA